MKASLGMVLGLVVVTLLVEPSGLECDHQLCQQLDHQWRLESNLAWDRQLG